MTTINIKDMVQRTIKVSKNPNSKPSKRDWYLGKKDIFLGTVLIPEKYWGKHVRFKLIVEGEQDYYLKELIKLYILMEADKDLNDGFIKREYVQEKINKSIKGIGITLHPILTPLIKQMGEQIGNP